MTLMLISISVLAFRVEPVKAATIVVPDDYSTIQEAINAANVGDTILVRAQGGAEGDILVNKSLNIQGAAPHTQIGFSTLIFESDFINFTGFSMVGGYAPISIEFSYCSNCNFSFNGLRGEQSHVSLYYSDYNLFAFNTLGRWNDGHVDGRVVVGLDQSDHNTFYENYLYSDDNGALCLSNSNDNNFSKNSLGGSGYYGAPAVILGASSNNIFARNTISSGSYADVLSLSWSSGNIFHENNLAGENALSLAQSSGNSFYHNNIFCSVSADGLNNVWDNGYPSGGNYWSSYQGQDLFSGPDQNIPGADGIGDTPNLLAPNNTDNYPFVEQYYKFDVAVTNMIPSKNLVTYGDTVPINVTVENQGWSPVTFNLSANATFVYSPKVRAFRLEASASQGWNHSMPGPPITAKQGDTISLSIIGVDNLHHKFYVDYNGNTLPDTDEPQTQPFINETILYSFVANTQGVFNYYCAYHQSTMFGQFVIQPQPKPPPELVSSQNVTLDNKDKKNVTLLWNTAGFALGYYVLSAYAKPVPDEIDLSDNLYVDGTVQVRSSTFIYFNLFPNPAYSGQSVVLLGNLTESGSGLPINDAKVKVYVNGAFVANLWTNASGWFQGSGFVSSGTYQIVVAYSGSTEYHPSSRTELLMAYPATFTVWTDKTVYHVGDTMKVYVRVRNGDSSLPVRATIVLKLPSGTPYTVLNMTTTLPANHDSGNVLWNSFTIPTAPLGNYTWIADLRNPTTGALISQNKSDWQLSATATLETLVVDHKPQDGI